MRTLLWLIIFALLGYIIFSDKKMILDSVKKRFFELDTPHIQPMNPNYEDKDLDSPSGYREEDRDKLDSILKEVNP